jgi:hypothetical protein
VFERRTARLLPVRAFLSRFGRFAALSGAMVAASLGLGAVGYHALGGLPWVDAVLNAAMILTGMGPVDRMEGTPAKLFAAGYALYSGVAFVTTVAVLFAPVVHRFLHALHLEEAGEEQPEGG